MLQDGMMTESQSQSPDVSPSKRRANKRFSDITGISGGHTSAPVSPVILSPKRAQSPLDLNIQNEELVSRAVSPSLPSPK